MNKPIDFIKKNNLYINLGLILLVIILGLLCILLSYKYREIASSMYQIAKPLIPTPKEMEAGDIGEVMVKDEKTGEEKPLVSATIPPNILNTVGIIQEVKEDSLLVNSSGGSFADRTPRILTVIFTALTRTYDKNQLNNYLGKNGLSHLSPGMKILIEGAENIRGKTEFKAKTINITE